MTSVWSFQMLRGPESERFARIMTMGSRRLAAMNTISFMRASPCELVQVKVRAPTATEPQQTLIAECSDSTGMNSASSSPSATSSARCSTMWVCGVMGYAATTSTFAILIASAAAMEFSMPMRLPIYSASSTILMHPVMHSCAQMPQPLQ